MGSVLVTEEVEHTGICVSCDWRSEYITLIRVRREAREHTAETGHETDVRTIRHTRYS